MPFEHGKVDQNVIHVENYISPRVNSQVSINFSQMQIKSSQNKSYN
jgi:hypothetical protein